MSHTTTVLLTAVSAFCWAGTSRYMLAAGDKVLSRIAAVLFTLSLDGLVVQAIG